MQEGLTNQIEYIGSDGIARFASLENTDVSGPLTPWQKTIDPWWIVQENESRREERFEWLIYLTQDGSEWKSKVHCKFVRNPPPHGEYISAWIEHKRVTGSGNHDSEGIIFLDWNRHAWLATIGKVSHPFPAQPMFFLHRLDR